MHARSDVDMAQQILSIRLRVDVPVLACEGGTCGACCEFAFDQHVPFTMVMLGHYLHEISCVLSALEYNQCCYTYTVSKDTSIVTMHLSRQMQGYCL